MGRTMSPSSAPDPVRPVVLLTDFGPGSPYVGQMELAVAKVAPRAHIFHLAHDLPPQNIRAAALVAVTSRPLLPEGAVLCIVVDPGVGTDRAIVAGPMPDGRLAVVPDNGLAAALDVNPAFVVENRDLMAKEISTTFHGRDVFAPVAAHLATGADPASVGPRRPTAELTALAIPLRSEARGGEILFCDHYGNLITNLRANRADPAETLRVRDIELPRVRTYGDAPEGSLVVVEGSFGNLEIAEVGGNAASSMGVGAGTPVTRVPGR